ncbi:hypothetical protein PCASD_00913 [Puccinia coronata f. sp. avenae]|uniref:Uncharacterized protein n=1 Tax=Puccinia coronata f. sp. avenae TaxID=200324 RepID=A0A2N5VPT4_9BASI|nr:hypothetical protein PCASD_00913 [Puccinia coronata f. sp. avenae]
MHAIVILKTSDRSLTLAFEAEPYWIQVLKSMAAVRDMGWQPDSAELPSHYGYLDIRFLQYKLSNISMATVSSATSPFQPSNIPDRTFLHTSFGLIVRHPHRMSPQFLASA